MRRRVKAERRCGREVYRHDRNAMKSMDRILMKRIIVGSIDRMRSPEQEDESWMQEWNSTFS